MAHGLIATTVAVLVLSAAPGAPKDLPVLTFRYAAVAVPDPPAAAKFFAKYTGGAPTPVDDVLVHPSSPAAVINGVRLTYGDNAYSDLYFLRDDSLPGNATAFGEKVGDGLSMSQDDWVWWNDYHLAFHSDQIDAIANALLVDEVPFVSRGSLYFTIPGTGVTIQILGTPTVYWTEPFAFCRKTDSLTAQLKPYPLNVTAINTNARAPQGLADVELVPAHQSLAVSRADACADWTETALSLNEVDEATGPGESHAYANGTCAKIRWYELEPGGYQVHYIEQYRKRDGGVPVADNEANVLQLNGADLAPENAFQQFRLGLSVGAEADLDAYVDHFSQLGTPFSPPTDPNGDRLRAATPSGYVFEIFLDKDTARFRDDLGAIAAVRAAPAE